MSNSTLLSRAEEKATEILKNQLSPDLSYHNYDRTKMVVDAVYAIGKTENLDEEQLEIVALAAWFHATGFRDAYDDYEDKSKLIAGEFLTNEQLPYDKIEKVLQCILVTKAGNSPSNPLQEVMLDATKINLVEGKFKKENEDLRNELAQVKKENYTDLEWLKNYLERVSRFQFYTPFGQKTLLKAKEKLRVKLGKLLNKHQKDVDEQLVINLGVTDAELKALKKKLQKAEGRPERGIETMFRLTSKNHISLSAMADSKANIMISVNSILISILLGGLMQKLDSNPHLVVPTIIILIVNLASMVFSILSIRPNVTNGLFTREDIANQKTNLLFFGNFHKMKRDDYHWGMNELMDNASFLYSSLIDDIYFLGVVLATKYRYLRISYNIFMIGIVIAVIAFIISIFFAAPPNGSILN